MLFGVRSVELWVTKNDRKCCWSWHAPKTNLRFLQLTTFFLPSTCQWMTFHLKLTIHSWKSWKLSFTSDVEPWFAKCGESSVGVELSWYSKSTFTKITFLNSSIKVWIDGGIFFFNVHRRNNFWLCPLDWNDNKLNTQKGWINAVSMSIFRLINL